MCLLFYRKSVTDFSANRISQSRGSQVREGKELAQGCTAAGCLVSEATARSLQEDRSSAGGRGRRQETAVGGQRGTTVRAGCRCAGSGAPPARQRGAGGRQVSALGEGPGWGTMWLP